MTTDKAREILKKIKDETINYTFVTALEMAIEALEQIDEIQEALDAYDDCEMCQGFREFPTNDLIGCIRRIVK